MIKLMKLPLIILKSDVIFPNCSTTIEITNSESIFATNLAVNDHSSRIVVTSLKQANAEINIANCYMVGTLCSVVIQKKWNINTLIIKLDGVERFNLSEIIKDENCFFAEGNELLSKHNNKEEEVALMRQLKISIESIANTMPALVNKLNIDLVNGFKAGQIVDYLANNLPTLTLENKQKVLAETNINQRIEIILLEIEKEKLISKLEAKINKAIKDKIDTSQKEYYLREKIKVIKEELGDIKNREDDLFKLRQKLQNNPYPEKIKERLLEEINHYEISPQSSSESYIIRSYISWLMDIPWFEKTEDKHDLEYSQKILDSNHYGLIKIKERIIEHLAVQEYTKKVNGHIICFVGPPGVGKTSLAKSISEAIGRNFVKASLGGVKDESEIRGHRKTYIGAMPGRIIQAMKKAKSINPVFLLDEIDKLSSDYKGDPASALLEVLDPEQNAAFSDNYIEEAYDLSNVMFITTANSLNTISEPLLDRMEVINLSSYTELEKYEIARKHLIPKILVKHNLKKSQIIFSKEILLSIIRFYTKEAGVRELERIISKIIRKYILRYLKKEYKNNLTINEDILKEFLGPIKFDYFKKDAKSYIGMVTGLAWTIYGGEILPIEVNLFPGKGNLILTGNLGNVMKESASIALGYIKSNAELFNIDPTIFKDIDIHLHCPEGAIPKDGPSAGITITSAIISAITKQSVTTKIAMTGEITLRGHILAIGGLKEKLIAATRQNISEVFIPKDNEKHLIEIPKEVLAKLKIHFVSNYKEVNELLFIKSVKKSNLKDIIIKSESKKSSNIYAINAKNN